MIKSLMIALVMLFSVVHTTYSVADPRPNILWIIVDDMSAHFSCYGESQIETPNVDRLAKDGMRFSRAFVTAPVCSTCRSAFITGMYQTSIGAHHHRSGRGQLKIKLPTGIVPVPKLFQDAGYYTTCGSWPNRRQNLGKTDYNFEWDRSIYNSNDWAGRKDGQPFFAQIHLPGGKLRGGTRQSIERFRKRFLNHFESITNPATVKLPAYYPGDETILHDWAAYLDSVRETDRVVGKIVDRLRDDGDLQNTVLLFMTDHGISHVRGKQFLYEEGIHVPLVIAGPGITPGTTRTDLVEHIDIAALSLGLAGIRIPDYMQARNILASDYKPREAVFSARDRCDETVDHLRSIRTSRYKYIRNFLPQRPYLQPNAYKDRKDILVAMRANHAAGRLSVAATKIMAETRPPEELYDLEADPLELGNLANHPAHKTALIEMRTRLDKWMEETNDQGRQPESAKMFESDMKVYLDGIRRRNDPQHLQTIEDNIALMKTWASQGK